MVHISSSGPQISTNVRALMARAAVEGVRGVERVSPLLAARAAEGMFLTPAKRGSTARDARVLAEAEPFTITVLGERLAAWSWAPLASAACGAPNVLLLHGWGGRATQLGAFVRPLRARGYRVTAFDVRAHGESPGRQATLVDFREGLLAARATVGPLRAVIAHSFGAAAVWGAIERGLEAERLVLIAPAAELEAGVRRFARMLHLGSGTADLLVGRIEARTGSPIAAAEPLSIASKIAADLLVIHDRLDREVAFSEGEALARRVPLARVLETRGLGHTRLLLDPDVVSAAADFVGGWSPPERSVLGEASGSSSGSTVSAEAWALDRFLFDRDAR